MNENDIQVGKLLQNAALLKAIADEQNFTRAAYAVGMEQSAVSHRIKTLERALGVKLFERTTRRVMPTEAGRIVCDAAERTHELWYATQTKIKDFKSSKTLRLSVSSSVAMKWIVPALPRAQAHGLDLVVDVEDELVDLHTGAAQAAIRYGIGPYPGLHSEPLITSSLIPVARPGYVEGEISKEMIEGSEIELLVDRFGESDGTGFSWQEYFKGRNWEVDSTNSIGSFARADLAIQAAISGMGIALGRTLLVENDLEAGFLVSMGPPVKSKARYWLVATPAYVATDGYFELLGWLNEEISNVRKQHAFLLTGR